MSDYISREAAIEMLHYNADESCASVVADFESIPAADVEPVRYGRWEQADWVDPDGHGFGTVRTPNAGLRCSRCACVFKKDLLWKQAYCPNCGAKMKLEDNNGT